MSRRVQLAPPSADFGSYGITKRLGSFKKYVDFRGKTILDVGCGNGSYTLALAEDAAWLIGIDMQEAGLAVGRRMAGELSLQNVRFEFMDVEHLKYDDEYFDVVTLIEVLEHVSDESKALAECVRVLKPGGYLCCTVPNKWYPFETHGATIFGRIKLSHRFPLISYLPSAIHSRIAHARIYTARRIKRLLVDHDLSILAAEYLFPPVDRAALPSWLRQVIRQVGSILEQTPAKIFGVTISVVAQKPRIISCTSSICSVQGIKK